MNEREMDGLTRDLGETMKDLAAWIAKTEKRISELEKADRDLKDRTEQLKKMIEDFTPGESREF